jgi:DNA polymerase III epsilon subunit-like protein
LNFRRVNLQNDDDVAILLLDVETTGLSPQTDHIIQLAAKLLGRDEIFCEYVLPPVSISPQIEKLTGITQKFLLHGGLDSYTGIHHSGPAKDFRSLYQHFCDFCQRCRIDSRKICLVAHNAAFDVRFLNAEVKRLSLADALAEESVLSPQSTSLPPMLSRDTGITTTVDTLRLFKNANFWSGTLSKPKSFALGDLYQAITQKKLSSAHHAIADVMALEEILTSPHFDNKWRKVASEIQTPLFLPDDSK